MAALEADREAFQRLGADIMAINPAAVQSHDRYCAAKGFAFPILSDPDKQVTRMYDALKMGGLLVRRSVYIVSPEGTIIFAREGMPSDQEMMAAIKSHHEGK